MNKVAHTKPTAEQRRWELVRLLLALNLLAVVAIYLSTQWDLAEHIKGAVDRFWYPPHFGIYFGLLCAALIPLAGLIILLRAPGLPFDKLRANPALVLVILANGSSFMGAPFDAWWHTTFGLDLTVWSPPHLHLILSIVLAVLACAVYFLDDAPVAAPLLPLLSIDRQRIVLLFTLTMAVLLGAILFSEYEIGALSRDVRARALWSYPVVWSFFALFTLGVITSSTRTLGMATLVTLCYLVARWMIIGLDRALLDFRGFQAYPLVIPALAFDLVLAYFARRRNDRGWLMVAVAGFVATTVLALTTPLFWDWLGTTPQVNVQPWFDYWPVAFGTGMVGLTAGWGWGAFLRRLRPAPQVDPATAFEQPLLAH